MLCADVPRSVWRVCCNPVYLFIILGACSHVTLVGFGTFLTKYLQSHFGVTAAMASIYTGQPIHHCCMLFYAVLRLTANSREVLCCF